MKQKPADWTPARALTEKWLESIGYCFHQPICHDSEECRAKRAKDREEAEANLKRAFTGFKPPMKDRKLGFD